MKKLLIIALALSCVALTPQEKKVALKAKNELAEARKERDQAKGELAQAQQAASDSSISANQAGERANGLQKQVDSEHAQLQTAVNSNAKMKPVYDRVNKYWGIGGIIYGFGQLFKHILILLAVLVGIAILLVVASFFFPALGPILSFVLSIWNRFLALFKPKPTPPPAV
jgi:hypothetical protein